MANVEQIAREYKAGHRAEEAGDKRENAAFMKLKRQAGKRKSRRKSRRK